jgi:DNA repair protein RadC
MDNSKSKGHRERLKESFLRGEETALTEGKLLELLLTYAIPQKDVRPLAKQLLDELGDLDAVLAADTSTLLMRKTKQPKQQMKA